MKKAKENLKKIVSSLIVMSLFCTAIMITTVPTNVVAGPEPETIPSIRIYGEDDAIYPTQSFTNEEDFIYLDETQPFDPGVIAKDSITFNPIFLDHTYGIDANGDACEKVFFRTFYEPGYFHEEDEIMSDASPDILEPIGEYDMVVTETTYHFLTLDCRNPIAALYLDITGQSNPGDYAKMWLPYESADDTIPGMDSASLLDIVPSEGPYYNPIRSALDDMYTDGSIAVEKQFTGLSVGDTIEFFDHSVTIKAFEDNDPWDDKVTFEMRYEGNPTAYDSLEDIKTQEHYMHESQYHEKYYFNRDNDMRRSWFFPDDLTTIPRTIDNAPAFRWYMIVENAVDDDYITLVLGRELFAGETFYVNGVRYDMPAVYTICDDLCNEYFKYITFQSPLPKGDEIVEDYSHVTSQYLHSLSVMENVWVLPPYSMDDHIMVDDIGLEKDYNKCYQVPYNGMVLNQLKDALEFFYIDETIEPRFDSSLAERLNTDEYGEEEWLWYNIRTRPNQYTEFILPDQEIPGESYDDDCVPYYYDYDTADGFEYLITSSFIAPNSEVDQDRGDQCKSLEEHEIFHVAFKLQDYYYEDKMPNYAYEPRLAFEFDAMDGTDLYINDYQDDATVRIYGEECANYPTHSWWKYNPELDFIYWDETQPFDPGVIEKDSITFNPVYMDGEIYGIYAKGDASEKIFLRAFYEPAFYHAKDDVMSDAAPDELFPVGPYDMIVTETTYHFVTLHGRQPLVGVIDESRMWLPYESEDDAIPGMEKGDLLDIAECEGPYYYPGRVEAPESNLVDGYVGVEKQFSGMAIGDTIEFMDHSITLKMFEDNDPMNDKVTFDIRYEGNPTEYDTLEDIKAQEHVIYEDAFHQNYYFNRDNDIRRSIHYAGDPTIMPRTMQDAAAFRWYFRVDNAANEDYITLTLGRELYAGETFYVNGVRYDIPAVYTTYDNYKNEVFKYVTLQSPMPKGDEIVEDFSHVTSQYLHTLSVMETIWVLPPYNMDDRVVIDDIGLEKYSCRIPSAGMMFEETKDALEFYYIKEDIEHRYDTSLTERLKTWEDGEEEWLWYNIFTKPNRYTEFVLPDEEKPGEAYVEDDGPSWYPYSTADGFEYIIATSWTAPNSYYSCKESDYKCDCHDITQLYHYNYPKMTFEFDADDDTGIYINGGIIEGPFYEDPVAEPGGPYSVIITPCCDGTVTFDGCGSYDQDDLGSDPEIVQYDWNFGDGTGWFYDIGCNPTHDYLSVGVYTVTLKVYDNEGSTATATAEVTVTDSGGTPPPSCDVEVSVEDINVPQGGYGSGFITLQIGPGYPGAVNVVKFIIRWDMSIVELNDVEPNYGDWDSVFFDDSVPGELEVTAYNFAAIGFTSGIYNIVKLTFEEGPAATSGDFCTLDIVDSELKIADGSTYLTDGFCAGDGIASIGDYNPGYPTGDLNLDGILDELDVYLLGTAVLYGSPIPPPADGDMNGDGIVDELDVYLLGTWVLTHS